LTADENLDNTDPPRQLEKGGVHMAWDPDEEDTRDYKVVVNHEEQYSIWLTHKPNPLGWLDVGPSGKKDVCLKFIGEIWTDMRPLGLRRKMEEAERKESAGGEKSQEADLRA
jgi:MbtH protein